MTSADLVNQIKGTEFSDVCDVIELFELSGSDIKLLSELDLQLKIGPQLDNLKLQKFRAFVHVVKTQPHKLMYYKELSTCANKMAEYSSDVQFKVPASPDYEVPPQISYTNPSSARTPSVYCQLPKVDTNAPFLPEEVCYLEPIKAKILGSTIIESHRFYRCVDRKQGKELLNNTPTGTYLLRPSGESSFLAVLMIHGKFKTQNIPIWFNKSTEQFYLNTSEDYGSLKTFRTVDELLQYYTVNDINDDKLLRNNEDSIPPVQVK